MEGIFEVMNCTDRQKAILTAFKLEGNAKPWWKAAKKTFDREETDITWTSFKKVFIRKVYSHAHQIWEDKRILDIKTRGHDSLGVFEQVH